MKSIWLRSLAQLLGAMILILGLTALSLAAAQQSHASSDPDRSQDTGQATELPRERLVRDLEHTIAKVQPLLDRYGYPAVFLAVMVEGIGLLAPGQTLLIAAALTATKGGLNIAWVLIWTFTGAVLGNSLGYLLGRWGGRPLLHKMKVNEQRLQRMEEYFTRYGKGVVLVARFFDGLRQLNGIVAGILKMPWKVFTIFNILGAVLWTGMWGLGAYFLDKEITSSHLAFRKIEPWIAFLCLLGFMALLVYLLWHRRIKND
jgi:membrane protein DedA with SNARE-associated domain